MNWPMVFATVGGIAAVVVLSMTIEDEFGEGAGIMALVLLVIAAVSLTVGALSL